MEPYEYKSAGDRLKIRSGNNGLAIVGIDEDTVGQSDIIVHSEALPEITGKLFEACGLPAPAIIPASGARFPDQEEKPFRFGPFGFRLYPGGISPSLPGIVESPLPPGFYRELAAHLVALADHAEANPALDPEEVEELARELHSRGPHGCGCGAAPERPERHAEDARTALRWMNARKAASDA